MVAIELWLYPWTPWKMAPSENPPPTFNAQAAANPALMPLEWWPYSQTPRQWFLRLYTLASFSAPRNVPLVPCALLSPGDWGTSGTWNSRSIATLLTCVFTRPEQQNIPMDDKVVMLSYRESAPSLQFLTVMKDVLHFLYRDRGNDARSVGLQTTLAWSTGLIRTRTLDNDACSTSPWIRTLRMRWGGGSRLLLVVHHAGGLHRLPRRRWRPPPRSATLSGSLF